LKGGSRSQEGELLGGKPGRGTQNKNQKKVCKKQPSKHEIKFQKQSREWGGTPYDARTIARIRFGAEYLKVGEIDQIPGKGH